MQEAIKLTANGLDDWRRAMPGIEAADASGKVDKPVTVNIFDDRTFSLVDENGRGMKRALHNGSITPLHQRLRARPGNGSAKLNGRHK